jgi:hypothetical protein
MLIKRQAVVVIHGIGEQKPMSTIRGFVDSISDYSSVQNNIQVFNIPDTFSGSYELRQLAMYKGEELRTDFFEYYWAYNMRGTKLYSVWTWLVQLICRKPKDIPMRVKWLYYMLWFIALVYVVVLVFGVINIWVELVTRQLPVLLLIGNFVLNILAVILTSYLGDAARYTYAAPDNVEEREKIRKGGVELLDQLHRSKKYFRIIVVGHSLGSMIGYDILKHYWAKVYKVYDVLATYPRTKMDMFNDASKAGFDFSNQAKLSGYMALQSDLMMEQQARGNSWLITDFITLGSPLAHGELLMADLAFVLFEHCNFTL